MFLTRFSRPLLKDSSCCILDKLTYDPPSSFALGKKTCLFVEVKCKIPILLLLLVAAYEEPLQTNVHLFGKTGKSMLLIILMFFF